MTELLADGESGPHFWGEAHIRLPSLPAYPCS